MSLNISKGDIGADVKLLANMEKYFVYYDDSYEENTGLQTFNEKQKALNFIRTETIGRPVEVLKYYTLIKGKIMPIKAENLNDKK